MEDLKMLLEKHFIYKEADKELYYSIYDNQKNFRPFLVKLGFQLIIRSDFLRLEKIPAEVDAFMGFEGFRTVEEYILFMLLLIFLEDKPKEEQFLLADIIEFMESNSTIAIDTTQRRTRQSICRVLCFARECYLILCVGGNIDGYVSDSSTQVLYDNTGLSKYFMRYLPAELHECQTFDDLYALSESAVQTNPLTERRSAAYRNLILRPAVFNTPSPLDEYTYIKNYRSTIADDFEQYLGWSVQVHKEMAMAVPQEGERIGQAFPIRDGWSSAVLLFNLEVCRQIKEKILSYDKSGHILLSREEFEQLALWVKAEKEAGLTQGIRNMSPPLFTDELLQCLVKYMMCQVEKDVIILLPVIGKIVGDYPKSFYATHNQKEGAQDE